MISLRYDEGCEPDGVRYVDGMNRRRGCICALAIVGALVFHWTFQNLFGNYYLGKPSNQMMVGDWQMNSDSLRKLHRAGYTVIAPDRHRFVLRADGTCQFRSYWMYIAPDLAEQAYMECGGRWQIVFDQVPSALSSLLGVKHPILEIKLQENSDSSSTVRFYLTDRNRRLTLWEYLGDPDDDEHVEFEKLR